METSNEKTEKNAGIKKALHPKTWAGFFIPENPAEHGRMLRFLFLTFFLTLVLMGVTVLISFAAARTPSATVRVPSVTSLNITDAVMILQSENLDMHFEMVFTEDAPKYYVLEQYPAPGTAVRTGRPVDLTISMGMDVYTVPDIEGMSRDEAVEILNQERVPYTMQVTRTNNLGVNQIIAMNYPQGKTVPRDKILMISVTDSILENEYKMQNFVGQNIEFAANNLYNERIYPIIITSNVNELSNDGIILAQSTPAGDTLQKNASSTLYVGLNTYNDAEKRNLKWRTFNFYIPRGETVINQIIVTNEDGTIEDLTEIPRAKNYRAVVEDELGIPKTVYSRWGAEGSRFNVVFKSYGKTTIRVFADDEVIGERIYN